MRDREPVVTESDILLYRQTSLGRPGTMLPTDQDQILTGAGLDDMEVVISDPSYGDYYSACPPFELRELLIAPLNGLAAIGHQLWSRFVPSTNKLGH